MHLEIDELTRPQVIALLNEHLADMFELSPPDQVFALDVSKLKAPEITLWTAWEQGTLLGCGALKALSPVHGEIKSMRTSKNLRGQGAGRAILAHIIETATLRGYETLSLETGTHPAFAPAQQLYQKFDFAYTGPFSDYAANPHSVFMSLQLAKHGKP